MSVSQNLLLDFLTVCGVVNITMVGVIDRHAMDVVLALAYKFSC